MRRPPYLLFTWPALFLFVAACPLHLAAQDKAAAEATIDRCDGFFAAIRKSMRSIPQSTLQNWVRIQEASRDLSVVAEDAALPLDVRMRARYTLAFGLEVIALPDVAAAYDRMVCEGAGDEALKVDAGDDLGAALESAGDYAGSADARKRAIAVHGDGTEMQYNNLALVLLKGGAYDECLKYIEKIDLNGDNAHTRIFSARAYGFSGRYDKARSELKKSCDAGEKDACDMYSALTARHNDSMYWAQDLEQRRALWTPDNRFGDAVAFADSTLTGGNASTMTSRFAASWWFGEIFGMYRGGSKDDAVLAYPKELPRGRIAFSLVGGAPLLVIATVSNEPAALDSVRAYVKAMHGPSAWDAEMPIRTRALVAPSGRGNEMLVAVVHTDWLEETVRTRFAALAWKPL